MSETFKEHIQLVQKILTTLLNSGIKIKVKKCDFFCNEVVFLAHKINQEGIQKSLQYIDKVRKFPKPNTVTELRQFLELVNFQRSLLKNVHV